MLLLQQKQKPSAGGYVSASFQAAQSLVQLEDGSFSPYWQAVNKFRNTRQHTKMDKERSSSAFQVPASGYGFPFNSNPSKCCPAFSRNLTEEVRFTLVFMKYYSLSNRTSQEGQIRCALDEFPWNTATKIAQVCCALLQIWQRGLRNSPVFPIRIPLILLFLFSQTLLFLLCYFGHQNMLFVCIPISSPQIIFLSEKRICPLSWRS